jgi:demethylmenaquinone methyltransferase/2-methoxy-6-polyprenyl-1,4-benzoquinol methylase
MLCIANDKRRQFGVSRVSFHRGDIMRLPFGDRTFDCVTGGYALRNVPDVRGALEEIMRVLRPGGRFLSLDFGRPSNRVYRWLYLNYLTVVGSAAGLALHGDADTYRYIPESLKLYPGQHGIQRMMLDAGFISPGVHQFGGGIMAINYGSKPK